MSESVEREVVLPVPVEEAWEAVTEPGELEEWLADEVELDLEEGGAARFRWDDGTERTGTVELVAEPVRFAFRWEDSTGRGESFVELTLIPVDEGTRVRVVETGPTALAGRLPSLAAIAGLVRA
ncbi:MAG: SRPBCC domain-containing protein [Thermoleophilaceae bacterium]|jgi:uncharacterized protein YndB with AHSA1/START domain